MIPQKHCIAICDGVFKGQRRDCSECSDCLSKLAFSGGEDEMLNGLTSEANWELSANTAAFNFSNWISYRMRMNPAKPITGRAENMVTNVNFHPNANDIAMHPTTLKTAMSGKAMFAPRSSCNCVGSVDSRDVNEPAELPSAS